LKVRHYAAKTWSVYVNAVFAITYKFECFACLGRDFQK
jgi:hypothetical protein